tara:strand:+ start:33208 stop:33468 length:261 start_codon:yes stop_codon:yes gene_type:complete
MNASWEELDGQLPNGKKVEVFYNHQTTLTVVPNYLQGRTLIFNDKKFNDKTLPKNTVVSCIVENKELKEHSPEEIFAAAQQRKENI